VQAILHANQRYLCHASVVEECTASKSRSVFTRPPRKRGLGISAMEIPVLLSAHPWFSQDLTKTVDLSVVLQRQCCVACRELRIR